MKYAIVFIVFFAVCGNFFALQAQEVRATVSIQTPKLSNSDPRIFKTLENDLRDFINNRKWTDDGFKLEERVECSFLLTVTNETGTGHFNAQLTVQSNRPVYKSAYNTVLFNYQDKMLEFDYIEFKALNFNENTYNDELTATIAYYVYIVLGMDYDSFSPNGGTPFYNKAQQIVNNAQASSASKSWQPQGTNRNRYWLIENLANSKYARFRQAYYDYHRMGLDRMYEQSSEAFQSINAAVSNIQKLNQDNPTMMLPDIFVNAKSDEIVSIFKDAQVAPPDKMKAYNAMVSLDGSNKSKYDAINTALKNSTPDGMRNMMQDQMNDGGMMPPMQKGR